MNTALFLLGIIVIIYLIYYIIQYFLLPTPPKRVGNETIPLSSLSQIITSEELSTSWTGQSGSTLLFYIYPTITDRTVVSGNEYAKAIQLGSKQSFNILVAPDAGRGYITSPAQLQIYVKSCAVPEIVDIPNFPLQKWTAVAIVKRGRKFNIYLNGKLTVSYTCTAMPDFDSTQPLRVGDSRLGGQIALMSLAPYAMGADSIRSTVESTVDTDGKPYLSSGMFAFMPLPTINIKFNPFCPNGNCNLAGQAAKTSPFEQWSSSYA